MSAEDSTGRLFLEESIATFRGQKALAERAVAQVADDDLHVALDENTNSIAVIMQHIAGNLLSRWTDFLTSDGEKPWRGRDGEFVDDGKSRDALFERWEKGWARLFETTAGLTEADLAKTITIRGHKQTVLSAVERAIAHFGYHIGQIVILARHLAGDAWETLSIPRGPGESERYDRRVWKK